MKVYEILEQNNTDDKYTAQSLGILNAQDIAELLENECDKFIQSYRATGVYLYRGIKEMQDTQNLFVHADIRKDRRPVFMDLDKHNLINDAMKNIGLKAHRGNSIFCSTDEAIAMDWGKVYLIFIKDDWNCTYFKKVKEHYAFDELYNKANELIKSSLSYNEQLDIMSGFIKDLQPQFFNSSNKLNLVLSKRYTDIIFTGSKYYALDISSRAGKKLTNEVFDILGLNKL